MTLKSLTVVVIEPANERVGETKRDLFEDIGAYQVCNLGLRQY
jgi:hypothetical protein